MDFKLLKSDLVKDGKIVVKDKSDPYAVFVPDRAKLKVRQVSGSTSGAGSGDFHVYRATRRKEQFRIAKILEEADRTEKFEAMIKRKEEAYLEQQAVTAKKASKRKRRKEAKKKARKKQKGEAQNNFSNDGSFMEKFKLQKQRAVVDISPEWAKAISAIEKASKKKSGKKKSSQLDSLVPDISYDGKEVVVSMKNLTEDAEEYWVEWLYVKTAKGNKILGAKKYSAEESSGKCLLMRLEVEEGTKLVAYSFSKCHGLQKTQVFEATKKAPQKLVKAANLEALSMKICTFLEQESSLRIKESGSFHMAISGDAAEFLKASIKGCVSETKCWNVWVTDDDKSRAESKRVKETLIDSINIPDENFHAVEAPKEGGDSAFDYSQEISKAVSGDIDPQFDLVLLKLGKDGGICRLAPGSDLMKNDDVLVANDSNEAITFTTPLLNSSKKVGVIVDTKTQDIGKNCTDTNLPLSRMTDPSLVWFALEGSTM